MLRGLTALVLSACVVAVWSVRLGVEEEGLLEEVVSEEDGELVEEVVSEDGARSVNGSSAELQLELRGLSERCRAARNSRNRLRLVVGLAFAKQNLIMASEVVFYTQGLAFYAMWYGLPALAYTAPQIVIYLGARHLPAVLAQYAITTAPSSRMVATIAGLLRRRRPVCCCGELHGEQVCGLVEKQCTAGWVHNATACEAEDIEVYSEESTVDGCSCLEFSDCKTQKLKQGHAWCETKGHCGKRFHLASARTWDYCRIAAHPLELGEGEEADLDDENPMAEFVPNDYYQPLKFRSYEFDQVAMQGSDCFGGVPVEMLSSCARKCLDEGAYDDLYQVHECHAFSFNMETRTCVRLPSNGAGTKFHPFFSPATGRGWVNYIRDGSRQRRQADLCSDLVEGASERVWARRNKCQCSRGKRVLGAACDESARGRRFFNPRKFSKAFDGGECSCQ